ncbi:MAG: glycosyltransferase family 4 protein [Chloroflexi bacterium]|nr:glycosyltransferase family 4 protein [Chloroflexota bacterium]
MRIGIDGRYIQDHFPGIGRYTYNLVDRLARLRGEDFVLFHNPALPNSRYDLDLLGRLAHLRLRSTAIPTFSWQEQVLLRRIVRQEGIAVFHSPYYIMPYFFLPCPSVVTIHDVFPAHFPQYLPSRRAWLAFHITMRLATRRARHILADSECSKQDLQRIFGVPGEKVTVVYPGVDASFHPRPQVELAGVKEKYGLPPRFMLYLGINKPHKNLPRLVEAYAAVRNDLGCPLVLAGKEDPRWPQTRHTAARLGIEDSVRFLGDVPEADLPALYNLATVFVMPSLYEGFGLPLAEAMASGVACVSSDAGSLSEVAGEAALLVDPHDTAAMGEAMRRVLADQALAERLREKGLAQAAGFTYTAAAQQALEVYRRCVA